MPKITLQEYADKSLADEYRQPLKLVVEALAVHGWDKFESEENGFQPWCCSQPVDIESFIGCAYHAECAICGQFVHDMSGPSFGNSYVNIMDSEKVEMGDSCWIAGTRK